MAFRKICPSSIHPAQVGPEITVSSSYRLQDGVDPETGRTFSAKRRRAPHFVTKNACVRCKKARAKCDGNDPCRRCASRTEGFPCVYETHVKYAKEELVKKVNQLQEQIKQLEEEDHLAKQILRALSAAEQVPEIIDRLQKGDAYKSITEWLDHSLSTDSDTPPPMKSQYSISEDSDHEIGSPDLTYDVWTSVVSDSATIDHLLQIYFEFVHPVHPLFNKDHFFDCHTRHSDSFCSSILINALCAMACHLHSRTNATEPEFEELGLKFSDSVRSEIDALDRSVTTIQTFAVMFLVDLFRSNALRAASYLKTASNILTRVETSEAAGFREVLYDTVRGLHNLNVEWAQMTFQVPPAINLIFPSGIESLDELAQSKTDLCQYDNHSLQEQPGLVTTAILEKSKLVDIIDDVVTMMYAQRGSQITTLQVLQQLDRLFVWHDELLREIAGVNNDHGQAPSHVLSLLILYSNSVVQLLRPLLDLEGFPVELVEDTILNHVQQGLFFLEEHYQSGYTGQYQSTLQMFAALHLIDVAARFFPQAGGRSGELGLEAVEFGCRMLNECRDKYPVAGPFHEMLQRTAIECGISMPKPLNQPVTANRPDDDMFREDDLIDACTMHTYLQPVNEIHKKYCSSFCEDWITHETSSFQSINFADGGMKSIEERGARRVMEIRNLLNIN